MPYDLTVIMAKDLPKISTAVRFFPEPSSPFLNQNAWANRATSVLCN